MVAGDTSMQGQADDLVTWTFFVQGFLCTGGLFVFHIGASFVGWSVWDALCGGHVVAEPLENTAVVSRGRVVYKKLETTPRVKRDSEIVEGLPISQQVPEYPDLPIVSTLDPNPPHPGRWF